MNTKTVLGFDVGTKSIGVAVGQQITSSATPLLSLKAVDGIPNWDEIAKLIQEWQPDLVVVGLPLNMDGTEQEMTHRARKFAMHAIEQCQTDRLRYQQGRYTLWTGDAGLAIFLYHCLHPETAEAAALRMAMEYFCAGSIGMDRLSKSGDARR